MEKGQKTLEIPLHCEIEFLEVTLLEKDGHSHSNEICEGRLKSRTDTVFLALKTNQKGCSRVTLIRVGIPVIQFTPLLENTK